MEYHAHTVLGVLLVLSSGVMATLWFILHRDFKRHLEWKDELSQATATKLSRQDALNESFKREVRAEFSHFREWYKQELGRTEAQLNAEHIKCREEVLRELKTKNGVDKSQSEEALILKGRLEVKKEKLKNINESIKELKERMSRLEYDFDKALIDKNHE